MTQTPMANCIAAIYNFPQHNFFVKARAFHTPAGGFEARSHVIRVFASPRTYATRIPLVTGSHTSDLLQLHPDSL